MTRHCSVFCTMFPELIQARLFPNHSRCPPYCLLYPAHSQRCQVCEATASYPPQQDYQTGNPVIINVLIKFSFELWTMYKKQSSPSTLTDFKWLLKLKYMRVGWFKLKLKLPNGPLKKPKTFKVKIYNFYRISTLQVFFQLCSHYFTIYVFIVKTV